LIAAHEAWMRMKGGLTDWFIRRWPELLGLLFFLCLLAGALILPLVSDTFGKPSYAPAFGAALSIGTGGVVSFLFYYLVNERLERRRRRLLRSSVQGAYREAKRNIVLAVIHASQKGGRRDLSANFETIDKALTVPGFRSLFEGGRESDEGFYAFMNQMSCHTPEYGEIVFNLKVIVRAAERLIDGGAVEDRHTYDFFVRLGTMVERIQMNGPGYDESKLLCGLIWEMFAGWNMTEGHLGHDPIQQVIDRL
jgi:hypothetical protein